MNVDDKKARGKASSFPVQLFWYKSGTIERSRKYKIIVFTHECFLYMIIVKLNVVIFVLFWVYL